MVFINLICEGCGKKYKAQDWRHSKYCSKKCAGKHNENKGRYITGQKGKQGSEHPLWVGDEVQYVGLHAWINRWKTKPIACEMCGIVTEKLDAANIDHKYRRVLEDYIYLCRRCHIAYDKKHNNYVGNTEYYKHKKKEMI